MHPGPIQTPSPPRRDGTFPTAHWSWITLAKAGDDTVHRAALERICVACWYPLYVFVRRQGHGEAEAKDLTQAFFERLLSHHFPGCIEPGKGRLRSFLLASLTHFLANEWDRVRAEKRGGKVVFVPWDADDAEALYMADPHDTLTPAEEYDRRWGVALLNRALEGVRADWAAEGWGERFESLKHGLLGRGDDARQVELAGRLGLPVATVKTSLHRLRRRLRERLRAEVATTVAGADEVGRELQYLLRLLAGVT